jgi:hypothetical protein
MQHSAVDLENYARLYLEDRLRDAAQRQRANEVAAGSSLLGRAAARVQSWFTPAPQERVSPALVASRPVQLVPVSQKPLASSADPYAGMIVLVRGPKEPRTLDAA